MAAGSGRQAFQGALWVSSGLGQLGKGWRGQRVQGPPGLLHPCPLGGPCELPAVLYLHRAAFQGGQKAGVGQRV